MSEPLPPPALLLDTTLRDGEQAPGVALSAAEKAEYVQLAEAAGIRYLEIGGPQNALDFAACRAAARAASRSRLAAMALTTAEGVQRVVDVGAHEILFVVPSSRSHLDAVYGKPLSTLLADLARCVALAVSQGLAVNIGLEDASQADIEILGTILASLEPIADQVDCITVPDTRGKLLPNEVGVLLGSIRRLSPENRWRWAFHAHDDLGLATANSLAALLLEPPVDCVHVTTCGFGERAGNASLEQMATLASTRLQQDTTIDLASLRRLAHFTAEIFLTPIAPSAPIIGGNAFVHESGLHQTGLLADGSSYQYLDPTTFGTQTTLLLGKHSGNKIKRLIARQAGCAEAEVSRLQREVVEVDKQERRRLLRGLAESVGGCRRLGLGIPEAVERLKERSLINGAVKR
jgi:homocitrate synthase NifV